MRKSESVAPRRRQKFLRSGEGLLCDHDLARATARHAVHGADAEIRRLVVALNPFRTQKCADDLCLGLGRDDGQMDEPGQLRLPSSK